jgi:hypothetical protein
MTVSEELETICASHGGILLPLHVVNYAKTHPKSELHEKFTWDNSVAAEQWRLHEARMIIRAEVTVLPGMQEETRAWVNLVKGRHDSGGYVQTIEVLSNAELLETLLEEAQTELDQWIAKYGHIIELAEVVSAIKTVTRKRAIQVPIEYGITADEF